MTKEKLTTSKKDQTRAWNFPHVGVTIHAETFKIALEKLNKTIKK